MSPNGLLRPLCVLFVVLVALAGCLGAPAGEPVASGTPGDVGTSPPDVSPTGGDGQPRATPTGACEEHRRTTANPVRERVTPSPLPGRPASLTRASVRSFARDYERAYARNGALDAGSQRVETAIWNVSVRRVESGWVVVLTSQTNTWAGGPATGSATATVVHGDGAPLRVGYHVTDRFVRRHRPGVGDRPRPRRAGRVVECW